ncbi:23S rRNA (adenine(2030)-N(6))-methyltransferase RlmJ [Thalassomonas sp. M1454]|uniref:23S rRNA (adenine(2030)-N(6))-methyltransferase RlmJ n=1 Tax=Thalassomonas sp. M1454 TaxID=2594477 RepID=UPI00117F1EE5|nr:23S rRNA (adenine(2030)-N(6))-methyltransferase RlmJ [Thalassomonas sp. M1454]TRX55191.1 23S rRNA (adenine(2030)-N(6))-methyltransferase RlmJ [Thalassomonas sp. M1454]
MLSYRHSFHAGNFADVLKHIVQVEILDYMGQKDKVFDYIDTHSGAGLFNLNSEHSQKVGEYLNGIAKLSADKFPELREYFRAIEVHNEANKLDFYPGSPVIAQHFLRDEDKAWLFELHPTDFELLNENIRQSRRVKVKQEDGFAGLLSIVPPISRRAFVLIDPPYEIKTDYDKVFRTVAKAHKKFPTGTYAIWYPVVDRVRIDKLENSFIKSGIKDIQRFELGLSADTDERGMTSSGMIVINPPWTLKKKMQDLLPKLVNAVDDGNGAFFKCDVLVAE